MRIFDRLGREIDTSALVNEYGQPIPTLSGPVALGNPDPYSIGEYEKDFAGWTRVLRQYCVKVYLGSKVGDTNSGSETLGPERFVLKRIQWACDGEIQNPWQTNEDGSQSPNVQGWFPLVHKSIQGRCVEMAWQDEFTQFMAGKRALIVALLGDSDGFPDLPKPILLQAKQTMTINLWRIRWPFPIGPIGQTQWPDPFTVRFDFTFHGVMLLPPGTHESGAAAKVVE